MFKSTNGSKVFQKNIYILQNILVLGVKTDTHREIKIEVINFIYEIFEFFICKKFYNG